LALECFCYVYRELVVWNPMEALLPKMARRIHILSGWEHESGDNNHPDLSLFRPPSQDGEEFTWGGRDNDERYDWTGYDKTGKLNEAFLEAIQLGAGVADRAQYRNCLQFTKWGIPLVPHVKPPGGSSVKGDVEDGIGMVNVLMAGETVTPSEPRSRRKTLAQRAWEKMNRRRPVLPTEEELEAYRTECGMNVTNDMEGGDGEDLTGWETITDEVY